MDNFNYQAYLKSGKIYGESKLLTEEVSQPKPNSENMVADEDIAKEIKKLEDENPKGFEKEISRLKVRQAALNLINKPSETSKSKMSEEELKAKIKEDIYSILNEKEAEVNEIGMFMDPMGYETSPPEKETFTKKYVSPGIYDIFKHGEKIATIKGEGEANAYINTLTRELMEDDYLQEEKSLEDELLDDLNETAIFEAEEDVDVDVDVEDEVDIDVEEEDDIEIEKTPVKAKIEIGLTPEEEAVQDSLQAAMEASRDLDNSTLTDQIGNTITYFTRQFVVGDNTD